jgi:hypothetical protein
MSHQDISVVLILVGMGIIFKVLQRIAILLNQILGVLHDARNERHRETLGYTNPYEH